MSVKTFARGAKVHLHDDPEVYTITQVGTGTDGAPMYELSGIVGYWWPAVALSAAAEPSAPPPPPPQMETEDTPERLELLDDIVRAFRAELTRQDKLALVDQLDLLALAKVSTDAIMARVFADIAAINRAVQTLNNDSKERTGGGE